MVRVNKISKAPSAREGKMKTRSKMLLALLILSFCVGCATVQPHPAIQEKRTQGAQHPYLADLIERASGQDGVWLANRLAEMDRGKNYQTTQLEKASLAWAAVMTPNTSLDEIYPAGRGVIWPQTISPAFIFNVTPGKTVVLGKTNGRVIVGELRSQQKTTATPEPQPEQPVQAQIPEILKLNVQPDGRLATPATAITAPPVATQPQNWQRQQEEAKKEAEYYSRARRRVLVNAGLGLGVIGLAFAYPNDPRLALGLAAIQIFYNLWEGWNETAYQNTAERR